MFKLNHQKLTSIHFQELCPECYKLSKTLFPEEKFAMISQIRQAALSVHLNIAKAPEI
jgi:four helix bundle protein